MKTVRHFIIAVVVLLLSGFADKGKWVIDPTSSLAIHGSTNINTFSCIVDCYTRNDTLEYSNNTQTRELRFSKNRMTINVRDFDCGNKQISKDFYETLKADAYPQLQIHFTSLQNLCLKKQTTVKGLVHITLAGVTKQYAISYAVQKPDDETLILEGHQSVKFSDFNLPLPNKLMGLIKVQESLTVKFNLVLKMIE